MPTIASRTVPMPDNYTPVEPNKPTAPTPMDNSNVGLEPGYNTTLRCQLPPITAATDNLRQFYSGGKTPQYRVLPVPPLSNH